MKKDFVLLSGSERLALARQLRENHTPPLDGAGLRKWRLFTGRTQEGFVARLRELGYEATTRTVRRWETTESRVPAWLAVLRLRDPLLSGGHMPPDSSSSPADQGSEL